MDVKVNRVFVKWVHITWEYLFAGMLILFFNWIRKKNETGIWYSEVKRLKDWQFNERARQLVFYMK